MSTTNNRKRLDEVRDVIRLLHYSIHTERTHCEWIRKFVHFHKLNPSRGEPRRIFPC
ncbi:phage integrase N-terminal SAM-like domain-containing protein [uncultured Desulfosarcina sp.]|uniref:phage integrase N-terminal SAM-like domain-containing protein n=1 Tax=uncultured Desulfosarcina sp. TaxID=218289 RepID=UPI0037492A69